MTTASVSSPVAHPMMEEKMVVDLEELDLKPELPSRRTTLDEPSTEKIPTPASAFSNEKWPVLHSSEKIPTSVSEYSSKDSQASRSVFDTTLSQTTFTDEKQSVSSTFNDENQSVSSTFNDSKQPLFPPTQTSPTGNFPPRTRPIDNPNSFLPLSSEKIVDTPPDYTSPTSPSNPSTSAITHLSRNPSDLRSYRDFGFWHTKWHTHLFIEDPDRQPIYFSEISEFRKGKPDVALHRIAPGVSSEQNKFYDTAVASPVVGIAEFQHNSQDMRIGQCLNGTDQDSTTWSRLSKCPPPLPPNSAWMNEFTFTIPRSTPTSPNSPTKSVYAWQLPYPTSSSSRSNSSSSSNPATTSPVPQTGTLRLVDTTSDFTLALYIENNLKSWKKRGKLRVYSNTAEEDLMVIMLTCCAILERRRRKDWKRRLF